MAAAERTTDHEKIRQWVEQRKGKPTCVKGTGSGKDPGMLRIDMPGYTGDNLEPISWDEWFKAFDENDLAFLYQEDIHGERSNFYKLVSRSDHDHGREHGQERGRENGERGHEHESEEEREHSHSRGRH